MTHPAPDTLRAFIESARWFGGKGRDWSLTSVRRVGQAPHPPAGLHVAIDLAEVTYDGGGTELYQLPLAFYAEPVERIEHALVGMWEDPDFGRCHVYDAVHDRESMALWLQAFAEAGAEDLVTQRGMLAFHRLPGHELDLDVHSTLFSGEQSNSSIAFGEDSLMKVFRKVTPGVNPDIAIHEVLTRSGSEHVAALYGWLDLVDDAEGGTDATMQLAMLQQFLRTASDGWDLALASVRNLFAEADLHAEEVGGDFAGEAARLGAALAEVHASMREHFPVEERSTTTLAAQMHERLDAALEVVPGLAEHETALRAAFDRLAAVERVDVQQVHGDLHLGQTLRTAKGWKIVDFEGEPAKPLAERLLPDSTWRDVAGMLRSFDYAPRVVAVTHDGADPGRETDQVAYRANEWSERNRTAFVRAYLGERTITDDEQALLEAYVADKAVYETVYESRNRPGWLSIPLAALARMESR